MKRVVLVIFLMLQANVAAAAILHEAVILDELKRLNIETTGEPKQYEGKLSEDLTQAPFGVCPHPAAEQGGYDIKPYAGKDVLSTVYSIVEPYVDSKNLTVIVVTQEENIVCAYKNNKGRIPGTYAATENEVDLFIAHELKKLNIETVGEPNHMEATLPLDLMATAQWGVKVPNCREAGYNLEKYAGQKVQITKYSIVEPNNNSKFLDVYVATNATRIVCVYKDNVEVIPGIYPATMNFNDLGNADVKKNNEIVDDAFEPQQGAMIPCEICVVLYPKQYANHPETCPVCGGAREHFQAAQMMTKEMADEKAKDLQAAIQHIYDTTDFDDQKSDGFPHKYEEIRTLQHQRLIHALVYDELEVEEIVKKIHDLDKILGSPIGAK